MNNKRIGPRMMALLRILYYKYDGVAPSQRELYMNLSYRDGTPSNFYGSRVLTRCYRHGLMRSVPWKKGNGYEVILTEKGERFVNT